MITKRLKKRLRSSKGGCFMEKNTENIHEVAMKIILAAGNAREEIQAALKEMEVFAFTTAEEKLAQAKEHITTAHSVQTDTIQGEARGEEITFSLLFTHAQDHLMTVMSEWNTAKNLVTICRGLDERISRLEKK